MTKGLIVYHPSHPLNPANKHPTCRRKIAYRSRVKADNAFEHMMAKRAAKDIQNLHVYQCQHCGKWHLGNRTGKEAV